MKRRIMLNVLIAFLTSIVAASCASMAQPKSGAAASGPRTSAPLRIETVQLADPVLLEADDWGKLRVFSDFLDVIHGHGDFSVDTKKELIDAAFNGLPSNAPDGVVREITVDGYFEDGSPLVLRVGLFTPGADAAVKNEKVYILMSNIVLADEKPLKGSGAFINMDVNALVYAGLRDGLLTNAFKYTDTAIGAEDIAGADPIQKVMALQSCLHDQYSENDELVATEALRLIDDESLMPAVRIMAMMMLYDYYLSVGDLTGAGITWQGILEYSVNVPGDMTPEALTEMNGAMLPLMEHLLGL